MTTLKIYSNQLSNYPTEKLITTINDIGTLLDMYEIDPQSPDFQELFENELLNDIFEEEGIDSSDVHYELI